MGYLTTKPQRGPSCKELLVYQELGLTKVASGRGCGCSEWRGRGSPGFHGLGQTFVLSVLAPSKAAPLLSEKIVQLLVFEM